MSEQASRGEPASNLAQAAWVCYEWANQPYFSLVTIFLFAPYFSATVVGDPVHGQAVWGYTQAIAGIVIALSSPLLGAIADAAGPRKPWILFFTLICVAGCFGLWIAVPGVPVEPIMVSLIVASVGMEFAIIFANAMLPTIASERRIGLLSGIGIGVGQLAAIVALVAVLITLQLPGLVHAPFIPEAPLFGLSKEAHETDRIVGPISGLWFLVFMLPLLLVVPDQPRRGLSRAQAARAGLKRLIHTIGKAWHFRNVALYLFSRMAFYDGMNAIFIFGGILAASIFHWGAMEMAVYGIWVTLFAAFGAFVGGWTDQRFGSKATLVWSLIGAVVTFLALISFDREQIFFFIHVPVAADAKAFSTLPEQAFLVTVGLFGLMAGPTISSSRTMLARIAPVEMMTEFFGLYSLAGKATTFVAPLLIGVVTAWSGSQRIGLMVVVPLIVAGIIMVLFVREERATAIE
ncbi:MAG TPA: MFS transporter [Parvibaculum sp.]|uniref:MFS transporter n=1 Tax=Parvibaculum sp. TaxID=2024848 RepID=UPI002BE97037|nr:MFS transporter [Parvibaculum sp.]HMM14901.1 MFS transporter [Parvibaculum sp.]